MVQTFRVRISWVFMLIGACWVAFCCCYVVTGGTGTNTTETGKHSCASAPAPLTVAKQGGAIFELRQKNG